MHISVTSLLVKWPRVQMSAQAVFRSITFPLSKHQAEFFSGPASIHGRDPGKKPILSLGWFCVDKVQKGWWGNAVRFCKQTVIKLAPREINC